MLLSTSLTAVFWGFAESFSDLSQSKSLFFSLRSRESSLGARVAASRILISRTLGRVLMSFMLKFSNSFF
ncbi:MAG: hypothetical protein RSB65_08145, partial [Oscillospiraceae bacterium]